eukprot:1201524-Amphidinium_carterae.1
MSLCCTEGMVKHQERFPSRAHDIGMPCPLSTFSCGGVLLKWPSSRRVSGSTEAGCGGGGG